MNEISFYQRYGLLKFFSVKKLIMRDSVIDVFDRDENDRCDATMRRIQNVASSYNMHGWSLFSVMGSQDIYFFHHQNGYFKEKSLFFL
jgi:hypothetical protein